MENLGFHGQGVDLGVLKLWSLMVHSIRPRCCIRLGTPKGDHDADNSPYKVHALRQSREMRWSSGTGSGGT